ncbi:sodium- and chloride-dependent glycine transporter 1-like [Mercenaria mercenaria]|uniref:sodium- and chloride-dependent glycine transporter 1-like n=1 Tax=Mercenaria mercenaria TaxID=6596 RepID=UPI00234FAF28|nr:sodium- and chloride-dependent glycine transporter 1-like [Mercenaria mercenaria]XP_053396454.1 sodium- and chloride-dependent glycine transporter 1-like [Mercenaria mercenaria]
MEQDDHLVEKDRDEKHEGSVPSDESSSLDDQSDYVDREKWGSQFEFILAIVGYAVAFGNLMRFPYLCMRNGGGAFLIPFFIFMGLVAFPLYYLEVCLGQFSASSPLFVWRIAPLLKGLGWLMIIISGIVSWYYNTIIAWVLYYLVNSFYPTLPWSTCDNDWNTENCRPSDPEALKKLEDNSITNHTGEDIYSLVPVRNVSSAKEFWQYNVLEMSSGIDEIGTVKWHLVLALMGAWVLVFLCLIKGVKSVGKVVYVTALLPYVLLVVFLVRGLTLPGAMAGIRYYLSPDFNRLRDSQVWLEAAVQVFYSLGPTWGGVVTMASYNKFRNNCLRDTFIACLADCLTSFFAGFVVFAVVGYMAVEMKQPIEEVATAGPGLMFIAYPEAISKMPVPQLWAVLFFIMMITVGLDTQFGMFETLSSGIVDAFPHKLAKRKTLVTAAIACAMFILGLVFTTSAGIYIYNLIDWYASAFCMCLGGGLEFIAVGWYYGAERFSNDLKLMLGYRAPVLLRICWCFISPAAVFIVFILLLSRYEAATYEGHPYPDYAITLGFVLALIPVLPLPICFVYELVTRSGTLSERFAKSREPENWRPSDRKLWDLYEAMEKPRAHGVVDYIKMTIFGRPNSPRLDSVVMQ